MKQEKVKNRKGRIILIGSLLLLLVGAMLYLLIEVHDANKNKEQYQTVIANDNKEEIKNEIAKVDNTLVEAVKQLHKENTDVKGWIDIENTNIHYPLLQTTDNEYYVTHTHKKEKSNYGSIFINSNTDIKNTNANVIIYGHDMKNGQMFSDLLKYKDKAFYEKHPVIKITTQESQESYEIVYVFKSKIFYKDEKNVFKFYQYYDLSKESKYNEYVNNCKKIQLYDTGKTANYGEQLVTLITCEYSQENGRMVVVAKKIQ